MFWLKEPSIDISWAENLWIEDFPQISFLFWKILKNIRSKETWWNHNSAVWKVTKRIFLLLSIDVRRWISSKQVTSCKYELRIIIYCTSCDCNVDWVKIHCYDLLFKKSGIPIQLVVSNMNIWLNIWLFIMNIINIWLFICCKTKLKKKFFFFWKNIYFYKIYIICRKNVFIWKKKVLYWKFFLLKKTFFTEKNINENVKIYISFEECIFMQKMFVLQRKYKSFLNIYSFCKKINIY